MKIKNTVKLNKGSIIFKEKPFAYNLKSEYKNERCDNCLKRYEKKNENKGKICIFQKKLKKKKGETLRKIFFFQRKVVEMFTMQLRVLLRQNMPERVLVYSQIGMSEFETYIT